MSQCPVAHSHSTGRCVVGLCSAGGGACPIRRRGLAWLCGPVHIYIWHLNCHGCQCVFWLSQILMPRQATGAPRHPRMPPRSRHAHGPWHRVDLDFPTPTPGACSRLLPAPLHMALSVSTPPPPYRHTPSRGDPWPVTAQPSKFNFTPH